MVLFCEGVMVRMSHVEFHIRLKHDKAISYVIN